MKRRWQPDLAVAALIALGVTMLFALTPLDLQAARFFYRPEHLDHWPVAQRLPWSLLYQASPWVTGSLVIAGLVGLLAAALLHRPCWRWRALFVLLAVLIGPGLLINALFKDHWDRPRPRDIVQFGGALHYVAAPLRGEAGASFPCGHCSVGFLYGLGWWIWKRRRPWLAASSMGLGIAAGTALGLARMAAGGHFLSDVVWSALLAFGVAHALYYYVLHIPAREAQARGARAPPGRYPQRAADLWQITLVAVAGAGGVGVLLALFAFPHGTTLNERIGLGSLPRAPQIFEIVARDVDVRINLVDSSAPTVSVMGELHGFGLPTSRLDAVTQFQAAPVPKLIFRIEQRGWFTDLNGDATVQLPAAAVRRVMVRLERGNILVTDATRSGVVRSGQVRLDLRTGNGAVRVAVAPQAAALRGPGLEDGSDMRGIRAAAAALLCCRQCDGSCP